jgi:Ser/Thr protein kinase RdoA (MazF antagonist)
MITLTSLLATLPPEQQGDFYLRCARQVLAHYALRSLTPYFIQHNAGVVFRLDDSAGQPQAMLKIHENAGNSGNDSPEQLEAQWIRLAALTNETGIIAQSPIANRQGDLVSMVQLDGVARPIACTVQQSISGEHVPHWSPPHAHAIGALLATIHEHSSHRRIAVCSVATGQC